MYLVVGIQPELDARIGEHGAGVRQQVGYRQRPIPALQSAFLCEAGVAGMSDCIKELQSDIVTEPAV